MRSLVCQQGWRALECPQGGLVPCTRKERPRKRAGWPYAQKWLREVMLKVVTCGSSSNQFKVPLSNPRLLVAPSCVGPIPPNENDWMTIRHWQVSTEKRHQTRKLRLDYNHISFVVVKYD